MRLELPGDAWAELRDPKEVTRGARKPVRDANARLSRYRQALMELSGEAHQPPKSDEEKQKAAREYQLSPEEIALYDEVQEPLVVALVESWSFDEPITLEGLDNIPAQASDALVIHCSDFLSSLFVDTSEPATASTDPDNPT